MKRKLIIGSVLSALISVNTFAHPHIDYKHEAPSFQPLWRGFYLGLNVGGGWGNQTIHQIGESQPPGVSDQDAINAGALPYGIAGAPSGYLGGLQLGYNYQIMQVVLGVETDIQWMNIGKKETYTNSVPPFPIFTETAEQKINYLGTLRGRIGYAPTNPMFVYLTGGLAYAKKRLNGMISNPNCIGFCGSASTSKTSVGWTAGGGFELMFVKNWSFRGEYLYYNVGNLSQTILEPGAPQLFVGQKVRFKGNILRMAVNYNFL